MVKRILWVVLLVLSTCLFLIACYEFNHGRELKACFFMGQAIFFELGGFQLSQTKEVLEW